MIRQLLRRCGPPASCQIRNISQQRFNTTVDTKSTPGLDTHDDAFEVVFKFPHIILIRALARFKIYQSAVMLSGVPLVHSAVKEGYLTSDSAFQIYLGAGAALGTLYCISNIVRKLVCLISIHNDMKHVRLARMTFWGNRRNVIVPIESIVPLSEVGRSSHDIYTDLKTYDGSVKLYIPLTKAGIHDLENFEYIFGKFEK